MPKVSVAIPSYNRKEYLRECLESVFNQTFRDFEVIIFDNHSNYDVRAFLDATWPGKQISLIQNETNIGGLANFEKVFKHKFASEYVIVFHDDNTMHPRLLEREVKVLNGNPGVVWVGTGLNFADGGASMFEFGQLPEQSAPVFCDKAELTRLVLKNFHLSFDTAMYRVNMLEDIGPYAKKFFNWLDRPYMIDLAKKGQAAVLKEPLVNYRQHAGQISKDAVFNELDYMFNFVACYRDSLPKPLNTTDEKLFKTWATNNTLLAAAGFAGNLRDYFEVIKTFKSKGFCDFRYATARSLWYFLKSVKKLTLT